MTKILPELILLKYLLIYNIYIKYNKYINIPKEYKELTILYRTLALLQEKFPNTDKTVDELQTMVWSSYPQMKGPEREAISHLCSSLSQVVASDDVLNEIFETVRRRALARDLAIASLEVSEGHGSQEKLDKIIRELEVKHTSVEPLDRINFVTDDLNVLESHTIRSTGLPWRLACLNRSLGPLRLGDFGFLFARPESGKTTLLASEISHMAESMVKRMEVEPDFKPGPIVWFNNEEQGEKVRLRVIQASLGWTADELWRDKELTQKLYDEKTQHLIRIVDEPTLYRSDVEMVMETLKPSLCIFDQIDKVKGFDADRPDLVFGRIYQWARELSKMYCPIVGVCQSDGTGEGVKWLTMSHVAEAKTSKQAEADWILGIGRSNEVSTEDIRFFNISKNKLLGDPNTDPNERHGRFEVLIRPMIARFEDLE